MVRYLYITILLFASTAVGQDITQADWEWELTGGPYLEDTGTFTGKGVSQGGFEADLEGNFNRSRSGFIELNITKNNKGGASRVKENQTFYGIELGGFGFFSQPLLDDEEEIAFSVASTGTCPGATNYLWIVGGWGPFADGNDVTEQEQIAFGTSNWNGTDTITNTAIYNMNFQQNRNPYSINATCSAGELTLQGELDRGGTGFISSEGVIYVTAVTRHRYFGLTASAVPLSSTLLSGPYVGFVGESSNNRDVIDPIRVTLSGSTAQGEVLDDPADKSSGNTSKEWTITFDSYDSPVASFATGTVNFEAVGAQPIACAVSIDAASTGHNVLFCVARSPNGSAKPLNLMLVSTGVGELTVSDGPFHDFGDVASGSHEFTVTNTGETKATLSAAPSMSSPFSVTGGSCGMGTELLAGEDCTIDVSYSPSGPGNFQEDLTVDYNNGERARTATRSVVASRQITSLTVTPDPETMDTGDSQQFTAMASFSGGPDQDVTAIADFSVGDAGILALDPTGNGLGVGLAGGGTTITAKLHDGVTGTVSDSASVTVNGGNDPDIVVECPGNIADGGSIDYDHTETDLPLDICCTMKNSGPSALSVGTITAPTGFEVTQQAQDPLLTTGESTLYCVRLKAATPGYHEGDVVIPSNDPDEGSFTISYGGWVIDVESDPPPGPPALGQVFWSPSSLAWTGGSPGCSTLTSAFHNYSLDDFTDVDIEPPTFDLFGATFEITSDNCDGAPLSKGASCSVSVQFCHTYTENESESVNADYSPGTAKSLGLLADIDNDPPGGSEAVFYCNNSVGPTCPAGACGISCTGWSVAAYFRDCSPQPCSIEVKSCPGYAWDSCAYAGAGSELVMNYHRCSCINFCFEGFADCKAYGYPGRTTPEGFAPPDPTIW